MRTKKLINQEVTIKYVRKRSGGCMYVTKKIGKEFIYESCLRSYLLGFPRKFFIFRTSREIANGMANAAGISRKEKARIDGYPQRNYSIRAFKPVFRVR